MLRLALSLIGVVFLLASCGGTDSYQSETLADCPDSSAGLSRDGQSVVVRSGQVPTGGWSFAVSSARFDGTTLVIDAELTPPKTEALTTQALVNHCLRLAFTEGLKGLTNWRLTIEGDRRGTHTITGRL
jgi:hypothetical protein